MFFLIARYLLWLRVSRALKQQQLLKLYHHLDIPQLTLPEPIKHVLPYIFPH